jgi:hypothetical protein
MGASRLTVLGLVAAILIPSPVHPAPFPQLLPDASNFELTIREDPASTLPYAPACAGEVSAALACRAFVVTLRNVGVHTVHLSRIACHEPVVSFDMKQPRSTSGWWPISTNPGRGPCDPWVYENLRLRPGEMTEYSTRLVSKSRPPESPPVAPGPYTIRAAWLLWGCTEKPEGTDCLPPLQVFGDNMPGIRAPRIGDVEAQSPVWVISKEIEVNSPALSDFGPLKIGFELSIASKQESAELRRQLPPSCATEQEASIECTVFHFAIRNLGDRPIRNGRWTCSDFSLIPEYRTDDGEWKQLQARLPGCTANFVVWTAILPGKAAEGSFALSWLAPRFDTSPLYPAGQYEIRVHFHSDACFASDEGSFCIQDPKEQVEAISSAVTMNAAAFSPNPPAVSPPALQ